MALLLNTALLAANAAEKRTMLHLTYTAETKVERDVFITPDALKIASNSGMTLVAKAPKWEACISNTKAKKMFRIPYARWKQLGVGIIESDLEAPKADQKVSSSPQVLGLSTVHYRSYATISDDYYRTRGKPKKGVVDFFGTTAFPLTDLQRQLFAFWIGVPMTKELPILWGWTFENGQKRYVLQLLAWKQEPYNEHAFDEPTNYTMAHDTREVYLATSTDALKDMFETELQEHK